LSATAERSASPSALGERVRQLRIARGLTQTGLAADRFSKEYMSQIERGRVRPSTQTLDWLAQQLEVSRQYLETGVSSEEAERAAGRVVRAEAAVDADRHEEALECLEGVSAAVAGWNPELQLRALVAEAAARIMLGELEASISLLGSARLLAEGPEFTDVDRARVLFHLGRCRYKLSSIATAVALFTEALELAQRGTPGDDRLVSDALQWRSRCYRRQRDWLAAREDVERALELAQSHGDPRTLANSYFQASIIAERNGQWIRARSHAERAKALYEQEGDRLNVGRLLNNLGGLNFLLGKADDAVGLLKQAVSVALEVGSDVDAAQAISSLAQVHLRTGELARSEEQARHALDLLAGRTDFLSEIGNAQLVLGRALLEQDRLDEAEEVLGAAEVTLAQLGSGSHTAAAWMAQADLALRRGDEGNSLMLYRRAAETLQDVRF
jgi:tetratricopeptide (TPR) repeat protein